MTTILKKTEDVYPTQPSLSVLQKYDVTTEPNPTENTCGSLQYRRLKNSSPSEPFLSVLLEIISLDLHQIMGSINTNTGIIFLILTVIWVLWSRQQFWAKRLKQLSVYYDQGNYLDTIIKKDNYMIIVNMIMIWSPWSRQWSGQWVLWTRKQWSQHDQYIDLDTLETGKSS